MQAKKGKAILCLLMTVLLFSTFEVVSKGILDRVDPFQVTFWRFFFGGLLLFSICAIRKNCSFASKDIGQLVLAGFIGITLSMNLLQYSLTLPNTKASVVAVAFSSNPVFVFLFQAIQRKKNLRLWQWIGLTVCVLGLGCIFVEDLMTGLGNPVSLLMALAASASYGLYTLMGRTLSAKYGSLKYNAFSFLVGALLMLPVLLIKRLPLVPTDMSVLPTLAYLAFFVTGVAYWTYFSGLETLGASKGSLVFFLKPPMAMGFAWLLLGEQPGIGLVIGLMLVLCGVWLVNRRLSDDAGTTSTAKRL